MGCLFSALRWVSNWTQTQLEAQNQIMRTVPKRIVLDDKQTKRAHAEILVWNEIIPDQWPHNARAWAKLVVSQWDLYRSLGFDHYQEREHNFDRLVSRWVWEMAKLTDDYGASNIAHAAWLFMEEYGPELWPADMEDREHIAPRWRDDKAGFVYLRDRGKSTGFRPVVWQLTHEEMMLPFTKEPGVLHVHNQMFHNVINYFLGVHAGMAERGDVVDYNDCGAEELLACFLKREFDGGLDSLSNYGVELVDSLTSSETCETPGSVESTNAGSLASMSIPEEEFKLNVAPKGRQERAKTKAELTLASRANSEG